MNHPLASLPWGAWIGAYIVLTGLASGLTLVTRFLRPADERAAARLEWISSWIALACLGICTVILIWDLGRPARFFLMVAQFANAGSLMSWGAKVIALKVGLLVLYLMLLQRRRQALANGDALLTGRATQAVYAIVPEALVLVSFALAIYPAFLLSWTWSSPAAHNAGAALIYLFSAGILGAATTGLVIMFTPELADPALATRMRSSLVRMLAGHSVALGFVALSLRGNETGGVYDGLWRGEWACGVWLLVVAVVASVVLSAPAFGARGRIALSASALVAAAAGRYLIFAVH